MKNVFKIALITLFLPILMIGKSSAAVLNIENFKDEIEYNIVQKLKKDVTGEIKVYIKQLPVKTLNVPNGLLIFDVNVNSKFLSPNSLVTVNVKVDDKTIRTFGVPVEISLNDYVWVATEPIKTGKAFSPSNIKLEKKDISNSMKTALRENFKYSNYFAGKNFNRGEMIDARYLRGIPDVMKDAPVSIIFKTSNLHLVLEGTALDSGKIGDYIRVKNKKYKRYYTGKVISDNKILVKI